MLDGVPGPHGKGQFWGKGAPIVEYRDTAVTCAKTSEPIVMSFGLWTRVDRRKDKFSRIHRWCQCAHMGGHIGATGRIRLNRPSAAAMRSYVKLL